MLNIVDLNVQYEYNQSMDNILKLKMTLKGEKAVVNCGESEKQFQLTELDVLKNFVQENMNKTQANSAEIVINSESRLGHLDVLLKTIEELSSFFTYISEFAQNTMLLILNEAVSNAVFHGNLKIPENVRTRSSIYEYECSLEEDQSDLLHKNIELNMTINKQSFRIKISDSGMGFDYKSVLERTTPPSPEKETGRGIFILKNSVDFIEFSNQGKTLTMEKEWRTI